MELLPRSIQLGEALELGRASGRLVMHEEGRELLLSDQLRYVPRISGDELHDGALRWKIERKHKDAVCEMVARHRLSLPDFDDALDASLQHPYLICPYSWWLSWLKSQCRQDECLLASLPTGEREEVESAYDGRESADLYWVWTSQRVFLAYAGRMGDATCKPLKLPLEFESGVLKGSLVSAESRVCISGRQSKTIELMQRMANQDPWLWHASVVALVLGNHGATQARALAETGEYQGREAVDLFRPLWRVPESSTPALVPNSCAALLLGLWSIYEQHAELELRPPSEVTIFDAEPWLAKLSCESLLLDECFERPWPLGRFLARLCLSCPAEDDSNAAVIALLDRVAQNYEGTDSLTKVEAHLARLCVFARLYQACAAPDRAHACFMQLITVLPGAQDLELVLGQEDAQAPLRHLLDLLVHQALALWPRKSPERKGLLEIAASLVPLELSRLHDWMGACEVGTQQRQALEKVSGQLTRLGQNLEEGLPDTPVQRLRPADLESRLVHPAARSSKSGSLQAMMAKLDRPDHSALKRYCDPGQEGVLAQEIERVARLFDKEPVDLFISHGDRRFGATAFEGEPAFLLVGGEHRRSKSPAFLNKEELRFTLGAELAHLYLGHARVTSQELVSGAFDKGKLTFELLTSVVPFLSAFPWGRRLGQLAGYFDNKLVSRSAQRIRDYLGSGDGGGDSESTLDRSVGLIAAHRMMQLTADRAGLLCSGDLGACILAMWKLRPESVAYLEVLRTKGVSAAAQALSQEDDDLWRSLSTRAAALTAFAWSEEYQELRSWCWGSAAEIRS